MLSLVSVLYALARPISLQSPQTGAAAVPPTNISFHDGRCIDGGAEVNVTVRFPPEATGFRTFTWAPLPAAGSNAYAFALERALVVLSAACANHAGLAANAGNGDDSEHTLWIGRVDDERFPKMLDLSECGCGAAIFACGSGGCTGDNVRQMRALAAQGYTVVSPDSMASPSPTYPRARETVANLSGTVAGGRCADTACGETYWCGNLAYTSGCPSASQSTAGRAGCFSSNADHIAYDPAGWAAFYERVYTMRARELDHAVTHFQTRFGTPTRLVLVGVSEGGMVASRYSHPKLAELHLVARIVTEYACEYTYFVSCAKHATIGTPAVPVLNLLSAVDPYFGSGAVAPDDLSKATMMGELFAYGYTKMSDHVHTVASDVSQRPSGYGAWPLTGSCAAQMRTQGLSGVSLTLNEPFHGGYPYMAAMINYMIAHFLRAPEASGGSLLAHDGQEVVNSLCDALTVTRKVLSGSLCKGFEEFVEPQDPKAYADTRGGCAYDDQLIRPFIIPAPQPPACARPRMMPLERSR